jgi:integrase
MSARPRKVPAYRLHKPTGQAVVRLDGRDFYLGKHDTEASHEAYRRKIAEWLTYGTTRSEDRLDPAGSSTLTIGELILAFWTSHGEKYYRRADGTPTGELDNFRDALRPLNRLYGHALARDFGPLALKSVRQSMIESGLCRNVINERIGKVVRVFKWAVSVELLPVTIYQSLTTVAGLRKGRSEARETGPVKPVPESHLEAIRPHVARQVWAMVELQRLTGMRPGEVTIMRTSDLDISGKVWVYVPNRHKTEHHDKERKIYLGPRSQMILRPWLRTDLTDYLFSPKEGRKSGGPNNERADPPLLPPPRGHDNGRVDPSRTPGSHYNTRAYAHAIHRGCRKANVPVWGPNRLRHNAATMLRKEFGLDVARAVLGHEDVDTTAIYAERDGNLAATAMERIG